MESKHTTLPWRWEYNLSEQPLVFGKHGDLVCLEVTNVDAAFIVRAVNRDHLFDELVSALETGLKYANADCCHKEFVIKAETALAKARGETDGK